MKREAKLLLGKACDSLVLTIELFNRPSETGRVSSTLIHLDHSFEMLLKAAILNKGGKIRENRAKHTIGFDACVRRSLSDATVKFLDEEQALTLQSINGLRDAAQHHLLDISEAHFYIQVQAGVSLFRTILLQVFKIDLATQLPKRVLPISTTPPMDMAALFSSEIEEVKKLLLPGKRRRLEALARLRPLAILDGTIQGEKGQPSDGELGKLADAVVKAADWTEVFPGVASIELATDGSGPNLTLRFAKKEGIPIQVVAEGTPGASVVAVKRVDELGYYTLYATDLAAKLGTSTTKISGFVDFLGLRDDSEFYKEFKLGSQVHKRYSQKALAKLQEVIATDTVDGLWAKCRAKRQEGGA